MIICQDCDRKFGCKPRPFRTALVRLFEKAFQRLLMVVVKSGRRIEPEGVTTELGGRADNGLRPYPSLIKAAFMGGQIG